MDYLVDFESAALRHFESAALRQFNKALFL